MAERALLKKHGKLRVSIIRPAIVISAYEEPTPGWTDTLAAGGGIIFGCTSGLMHVVYAHPWKIIDMIPVDYVSNTIICTTVYTACLEHPQLIVCNSGTSHHNPATIKTIEIGIFQYAKHHPYYREFSKVSGMATGNPLVFWPLIYLTQKLPAKLFEMKANLPLVGSASQRDQAKQLNRILSKMLEVQLVFKYFANQEWIYQSNVVENVMAKMSPEDRRDFQFNVRNIDWLHCFALFSYGLRRFFIKEDCVQPGL